MIGLYHCIQKVGQSMSHQNSGGHSPICPLPRANATVLPRTVATVKWIVVQFLSPSHTDHNVHDKRAPDGPLGSGYPCGDPSLLKCHRYYIFRRTPVVTHVGLDVFQ